MTGPMTGSPMPGEERKLDVVVLEDNDFDFELIVEALTASGLSLNAIRATNRPQFEDALRHSPDLIVTDYSLPSFNANEAIEMTKAAQIDAPIIVVTGALDDEAAVRSIKSGASDYLLKDRLARLGLAAQRALAEQALQRQERESARRERMQAERLHAVRMIDIAISASLDLNLTLNVLLDQVMAHLQPDAACVLLMDPTGRMLEYAQGRGFHLESRLAEVRIRLGEGLPGRAAVDHRPLSIPDMSLSRDTIIRPALFEEGFVSYHAVPLTAKGQPVGVLELFHRQPFTADAEWTDFLITMAASAAIAVDNAQLFERTQRANAELALAYDRTLEGWAKTLELRDFETEGHSRRVSDLADRVGRRLGLGPDDLVDLRHGALLHDIGKIAVPDHVLRKPGPLDEDECRLMQQHPTFALEMLKAIPFLREAMSVAFSHHEKWDGTGYPLGISGNQIPDLARIFSICDVYDALRSERPYKQAWTREESRDYLEQMSGRHFDPEVVSAFLSLEGVY